MESVFPQAVFGKRTFVQLEFSRQRHSFAVESSRLGDFLFYGRIFSMSFYVGNVAIIKIKPELQQDFSYFFNVEYDKIQDEKFKIFTDELKKNYEDEFSNWYLKDWTHFDEVERWKGKYKTSYEKGILTYGIYYNRNDGPLRSYIWDVEKFIFQYCMEVKIFYDGWTEEEWYEPKN